MVLQNVRVLSELLFELLGSLLNDACIWYYIDDPLFSGIVQHLLQCNLQAAQRLSAAGRHIQNRDGRITLRGILKRLLLQALPCLLQRCFSPESGKLLVQRFQNFGKVCRQTALFLRITKLLRVQKIGICQTRKNISCKKGIPLQHFRLIFCSE